MKKINSNFSLINLAIAISFFWLSGFANATCLYEDFRGWKDCFIKEKLSTNINSIDLEVFQKAQFLPRVIELDRNQPERKFTFNQYLENIGIEKSKQKVLAGIKYYKENYDLINKIAEEYGVEGPILAALIGMESNYGTIMGNFNVIDSLASLSYEGRRKEFFEKELLKVLQIARNENLKYEDFKGSWAGAMGQTQFMPTSYINYAVDYDQDGQANIWTSTVDALASAANYLKRNGWQHGNSSIKQVHNLNIYHTCDKENSICKLDDDMRLILLKDSDIMIAFKTGKNFEVLMKWNRSLYFGLAVLILAKEISTADISE